MSDLWRPIGRAAVKAWRKNLPKGWRREDAPYVRDLPAVQSEGDVATVDTDTPVGQYEARETIDRLVADIIQWAQSDPKTLIPKVQQMKKAGGLSHLTDEEAARQLHDLAVKLAADSTERVYKQRGWDDGYTVYGGVG